MAMVILNPTDEEIEITWSGINHTFKPDDRKRVEDPMGRQVIHNYGNRGLVALEYGDEGEKELEKIKQGRARNDEFWTKQVINYNQINEARHQSQRPFIKPTEEVARNAKRLGIKLLEPYKLEDASSKQISMLMEQNKTLEKELAKKDTAMSGLQDQVSELTENFKKLISLAGSKVEEKPKGDNGEDSKIDVTAIKATYRKMGKKQFIKWVATNWDEIQAYPSSVLKHIGEKHVNLYDMPFPTDRPAVDQYDVT